MSASHARASFLSHDGGNVFMIFGMVFVPVMFMIGAATDYARETIARSALQQNTDAAALAVAAKMTSDTTVEQAQKQLQSLLNADPKTGSATVTKVALTDDRQTLCASSQMKIKNAFMQIAGNAYSTTSIETCATVASEQASQIFEIALVLDNSGSMNESAGGVSKIDALRSAATNFVKSMTAKSKEVKYSITPFAAGVKVMDGSVASNRNLPWIDKNGENSQHWITFGGKSAANAQGFSSRFDIFDKLKASRSSWNWGGCLESQKYPLNVNDAAPDPADPETLLVPYLAPDEPDSGGYGNDYVNDGGGSGCATPGAAWGRLTNVCKYKNISGASSKGSPNDYCPDAASQTLMQLTPTLSTVTSKISALDAGGYTNLHEGFMWGWRTLSPRQPFAGGRAYDAANNRKVMVFMTDGYNNWKSDPKTVTGSTYQALGYYSYNGTKNERFPDGRSGNGVNYQDRLKNAAGSSSNYHDESRDMLDELTLEACTNAKALGIEIFTIGFSTRDDPIDAQGLDLLKRCATNPDHYYKAENAGDLDIAFSKIGVGLSKLRLSK